MNAPAAPRDLLETTGALIDAQPNPWSIIEIGLVAATRLIGADRADGGWVHRDDVEYRPARRVGVTCDPSPAFGVPLDDPVVAGVLGSQEPQAVESVDDDLPAGAVRALLIGQSTGSILATRLQGEGSPFGLLCFDWVDAAPEIDDDRLELLEYFIGRILSPLLERSIIQYDASALPASEFLTAAELDVVRLAGSGKSYGQIARERGVSVNTVNQQLRSARRKTGAANTTELCARLGLA